MLQRCSILIAATLVAACSAPIKPQSLQPDVVFSGMCDASGAVPLSDSLFAIADDEKNVLRVYDANTGGAALFAYDVSPSLGIFPKARKKPGKPPKPAEELDIEAATLIGDNAYWITSHGRNKSAKYKAERFHFFATRLDADKKFVELIGQPNTHLLEHLLADPRFAKFNLEQASLLAPKAKGGLNIEGMTERQEGGVWIGFRNPVPQGKALLFSLHNPEDVVFHGKTPLFGDPVMLDLNGRGIRALSWWRGRYLIAAGSYDGSGNSALYTWDGQSESLQEIVSYPQAQFNPEAFFTAESRDKIMLFSDDGTVMINGVECKSLLDASEQKFRGRWLMLPKL